MGGSEASSNEAVKTSAEVLRWTVPDEDEENEKEKEDKSQFMESLRPQEMDDLVNNGRLNDTTICALLSRLITSSTCLVIDSLELNSHSEQLPSKRRKEAALDATRIIMPYHRESDEHWLLFVYSPSTQCLESFDSLSSSNTAECPQQVRRLLSRLLGCSIDAELLVRPCAKQTNGVDCGVHLVYNASKIFMGEPIPMTVDTALLRKQYHAMLSTNDPPIIRYTTPLADVPPDSPQAASYSPSNLLRHSSQTERHQTAIRDLAWDKYEDLYREYEDANQEFQTVEAASGDHLRVEGQIHDADLDAKNAETLRDAAAAVRSKVISSSGKEYLDLCVLPMVNGFLDACRGTHERRKQELTTILRERKNADESIKLAWEKLREARKGVEGWQKYMKKL